MRRNDLRSRRHRSAQAHRHAPATWYAPDQPNAVPSDVSKRLRRRNGLDKSAHTSVHPRPCAGFQEGLCNSAAIRPSKHEIPLRHRQPSCRFTGQQFPIGAHLIGLGIDLDHWRCVVEDQILFADVARVLHSNSLLGQAQRIANPIRLRRRETKSTDDCLNDRPYAPNMGRE